MTYNGHPLYYFSEDKTKTSFLGQGNTGFGAKWWLVAPLWDGHHQERRELKLGVVEHAHRVLTVAAPDPPRRCAGVGRGVGDLRRLCDTVERAGRVCALPGVAG